MRIDGRLVLAGPATALPPTAETAEWAVAQGRIDQETADALGYRQLAVSARESGPELAARAARTSLTVAGAEPAAVGFVAHAHSYYQGHDFWSPAHYVAEACGAHEAVPVAVSQMCNGAAAALEIAAARLLADPGTGSALVTTGDVFAGPGFDRWAGDYGVAYGDAGTAAVLRHAAGPGDPGPGDPEPGELALLSVVSVAAPGYEAMHRAGQRVAPAARWAAPRVDARATKRAFFQEHGGEGFAKTEHEKLTAAVGRALSEAGVAADDPRLRAAALPRLARDAVECGCIPALSRATSAPAVAFGVETGHLGAGDLLANAAALLDGGALAPGELGLLVSAGAGFTWSCAVVRRTGRPWSR